MRPERGRFTRAGWLKVLERHRTRFPLSDADRSALADFLASDRDAARSGPRTREGGSAL